jgi:hypothetical protein
MLPARTLDLLRLLFFHSSSISHFPSRGYHRNPLSDRRQELASLVIHNQLLSQSTPQEVVVQARANSVSPASRQRQALLPTLPLHNSNQFSNLVGLFNHNVRTTFHHHSRPFISLLHSQNPYLDRQISKPQLLQEETHLARRAFKHQAQGDPTLLTLAWALKMRQSTRAYPRAYKRPLSPTNPLALSYPPPLHLPLSTKLNCLPPKLPDVSSLFHTPQGVLRPPFSRQSHPPWSRLPALVPPMVSLPHT